MRIQTNMSIPRQTKRAITNASLIAFPMHGQTKLSKEGYRTRDGHLIEWFGRILPEGKGVAVVSRPEPLLLHLRNSVAAGCQAQNTLDISTPTLRIPQFGQKRLWWKDSVLDYPHVAMSDDRPCIAWNPFVATHPLQSKNGSKFHFDILDDWTNHFAFAGIKGYVEEAYAATFNRATSITANSEATAELAVRFGRDDVKLLTNGCDPQRFSTQSTARGPLTVGYVGKIGRRLDLDLILRTCRTLSEVSFQFAGPFLDKEYYEPLRRQENVTLLGDVHYSKVPELLKRFDIGWVPHHVGEGEVGGDVIKTYEYRAAGLPVLTTPVLGANDRGLHEVYSLNRDEHVQKLFEWSRIGPRISRVPETIEERHTWEYKANRILDLMR
ncbi:glycosyltransferase [Kocuria flava]|uniref:glycosyltransferase n=1 Tax=Kocuria flava TaxID=446860 RepID=UPI002F939E31